jgi:hypothetical protein
VGVEQLPVVQRPPTHTQHAAVTFRWFGISRTTGRCRGASADVGLGVVDSIDANGGFLFERTQ